MKAVLIGATGATGKDLLALLLDDAEIVQVDVFVRRELSVQHGKLKVHVIDFDQTDQWKPLVKGDVLFSCLGTTLKAAGSKEAQWKVDYDYQYRFAKAAKENQVSTCVLVSANGASAKSSIFYSRMKGQLEDAVKALNFFKLVIFQPPLLLRDQSDRSVEVWAAKVMKLFNSIGLLKSQKPLPTKKLAEAMLNSAKTLDEGVHVIQGQKILKHS